MSIRFIVGSLAQVRPALAVIEAWFRIQRWTMRRFTRQEK
jgi:hypothetical protein